MGLRFIRSQPAQTHEHETPPSGYFGRLHAQDAMKDSHHEVAQEVDESRFPHHDLEAALTSRQLEDMIPVALSVST